MVSAWYPKMTSRNIKNIEIAFQNRRPGVIRRPSLRLKLCIYSFLRFNENPRLKRTTAEATAENDCSRSGLEHFYVVKKWPTAEWRQNQNSGALLASISVLPSKMHDCGYLNLTRLHAFSTFENFTGPCGAIHIFPRKTQRSYIKMHGWTNFRLFRWDKGEPQA